MILCYRVFFRSHLHVLRPAASCFISVTNAVVVDVHYHSAFSRNDNCYGYTYCDMVHRLKLKCGLDLETASEGME